MMRRLFRWKAIVPLSLLLVVVLVAWWLLLDALVARGVEHAGAQIVGAKVDVAEADVRLEQGVVRLRGLQVGNPDAPMKNLVEAGEIVANLRMAPLLEKKVVVETLAVRGVRFGTDRTTSAALDNPSPTSGRVYREVSGWANRIQIPRFSLEGLRQVVNVDAIRADSLRTPAQARATAALADSMRGAWQQRLTAHDPRPHIDSARALVSQLQQQQANPLRGGVAGLTNLVGASRATLSSFGELRSNLGGLDSVAQVGMSDLQRAVQGFAAARAADYAYARGLLRLPSLDAPDISPALFGRAALDWVQPVLYWANMFGEYLPPGLDPRRRPGPDRARRPGSDVTYPGRATYPKFLLEYAEFDLVLGGEGVTAGQYAARLTGLTSAPAIYGKPMDLFVRRAEAVRGPRDLQAAAVLDHVQPPLRDSVNVVVRGLRLPTLDLTAIGARLALGEGDTDFRFLRVGDRIQARWLWRSDNVRWERLDGQAVNRTGGQDTAATRPTGRPPVRPPGGAELQGWARDLLWRIVSSLNQVEIDVRLGGSLAAPALGVSSNVGDAIAHGLRQELGREIERAEQRVRAEIDRLVDQQVGAARAQVNTLQSGVRSEIESHLSEVRAVETQLREELEKLTRRLPPGVRIPEDG